METLDLEQALFNLRAIRDRPEEAEGCRKALVSFVWIDTLAHHWPSRITPELADLRARFQFLKTIERSRFLKQRRLVLNRMVRVTNPAVS